MKRLSDSQIRDHYENFMSEILLRLKFIEAHLDFVRSLGRVDGALFIAEACYLQFRRICELVTLACLIAHNGHKGFDTRKLSKEWNAATLAKLLNELSYSSLPYSGIKPLDGEDRVFFLRRYDTNDFKKFIMSVYNDCSDKLHIGNVGSIFGKPKKLSFRYVNNTFKEFVERLDQHIIVLPDDEALCIEMHFERGGPVWCQWYRDAVKDAPNQPPT